MTLLLAVVTSACAKLARSCRMSCTTTKKLFVLGQLREVSPEGVEACVDGCPIDGLLTSSVQRDFWCHDQLVPMPLQQPELCQRRVQGQPKAELLVLTSTNNAVSEHVVKGFAKLAVFSNLAELGHIVIDRLS